ncbi:MAG: 50S ribosomal protein L25 [Anaerolineae bacterium]|nr:50S ribosomal protein L25 [Anaerolineae bacterium]
MAEQFSLEAQPRTVTGKNVAKLRREGLVPVVVYGSKVESFNLQIPYRSLQIALANAGGTNLINLNVEGSKQQQVLARSVQRDVIKGEILHVDFLAVDASTKITTVVQIHLNGEAPAVKAGFGTLLNGIQSVEIEALPADLLSRIDVDLSILKDVNDTIHVRDLNLGDKVTILTDHDDMIVRVTALHEVVEETTDEVTSAEPEVVKKGKADEDDDEE